jgi:hypothetical protein
MQVPEVDMADHYLLFSEIVRNLGPDEESWLQAQLQQIAVRGEERTQSDLHEHERDKRGDILILSSKSSLACLPGSHRLYRRAPVTAFTATAQSPAVSPGTARLPLGRGSCRRRAAANRSVAGRAISEE